MLDNLDMLNAKCQKNRLEDGVFFPEGRPTTTWTRARSNPAPDAKSTGSNKVNLEKLRLHPTLPMDITNPKDLWAMYANATWPRNVELDDVGVYIARTLMSGKDCADLFPSTFDGTEYTAPVETIEADIRESPSKGRGRRLHLMLP